jgi:cobaltochelatase CobN
VQAVLQNQDNREHDLLDSNDYYQFQGGMLAAVETLSGATAASLSRRPQPAGPAENPHLKEELNRVIRSRAANPKWIDGVKRHGYKGAFEWRRRSTTCSPSTPPRVDRRSPIRVAGRRLFARPDTRDFVREHNPMPCAT